MHLLMRFDGYDPSTSFLLSITFSVPSKITISCFFSTNHLMLPKLYVSRFSFFFDYEYHLKLPMSYGLMHSVYDSIYMSHMLAGFFILPQPLVFFYAVLGQP